MIQDTKSSRRWLYTLNNYTEEEGSTLASTDVKYQIIGKEVGEQGTPHLQGYIVFKTMKRLSALKKISPRAHWKIANGTTQENYDYCSKDGDFIEIGDKPKDRKEQAQDQKDKWLDVIRAAKEGTADQEYPREFIQYNSTIQRMYQPDIEIIDHYTGEWWYGKPGTGKSRKAREDYPDLYDKLLNKWWDDYQGQETVLIDDIDTTHTHMGLFLKRYADHYPFRAEYKGGSKMIRPKTIIVTSNYTIEEIFGPDSEMTAAIKRRYKTIHFKKL